MYKNYIFDFYGTLADIHTDEEKRTVWEKMSLFYGYYGALYAPEELKKEYKNLTAECRKRPGQNYEAHPEIRIEKVFQALFAAKGIPADEALVLHAGQFFRVLTTEYIRLYKGVIPMLKRLRAQGKKIYLLSNAQRIFTEYELQLLGIAGCFDGIMISSDYGVKKPDRIFFERLLETYHLQPQDCIMIGNDAETDIAGAAGIGMDTCYIHSNLSPGYDTLVKATYILEKMNIGQLCRLLKIT
ncbi:MAG: HAD family hydrolase [Lachnospiraceae bacterium]|nr:HAD family hydrolase [Lachnospiraceae bacterium]MDY4971393.1 HAD family hydrolase [Lachnospiraceae bacterium]